MKLWASVGVAVGLLTVGCALLGAGASEGVVSQASGWEKASGKTRVMTYNLEWFNQGASEERLANIRSVLQNTAPDIVGLQEIEGKAALLKVFPASEWELALLDDPQEFQEVALAVRKPYKIEGWEMVFPGQELDYAFPGKRDLLKVTVRTPNGKKLVVYVNHKKSRSGGRMQTDNQREMAAALISAYIAHAGDANVVYLADANDSPWDRSTNILESGNVLAKAGANNDYSVLFNPTDALYAEDWTTIGVHSLYFGEAGVSAKVPGAREDNERLRGIDYRYPADVKVLQTFFDQVLVSPTLAAMGVTARVYDGEDALRGLRGRVRVNTDQQSGRRTVEYTEQGTIASDHVPVFADIQIP